MKLLAFSCVLSLNLRGLLLFANLQRFKKRLQEQPKEKDAPDVVASLP